MNDDHPKTRIKRTKGNRDKYYKRPQLIRKGEPSRNISTRRVYSGLLSLLSASPAKYVQSGKFRHDVQLDYQTCSANE